MCADEPTSGLDSFTAVTVMESIKRLTNAVRNTTVICSIHQPRTDVFNLFDYVLILSKGGYPIYCGAISKLIPYFQNLGYECPITANPADYFVDLSSVDIEDGNNKMESIQRVNNLIDSFSKHSANEPWVPILSNYESTLVVYHPSWFVQVWLLYSRLFLNNFLRNPVLFFGSLGQALILGLVVMAIFWQLDESTTSIESRGGLMYICISMESYILMIISIERYCREVKVFDRELQDQFYHSSSYFVAHLMTTLPQLFCQSILYTVPIYFGCNLRHGFQHYIIFFIVNFLLSLVINGLAWKAVSLNRVFSVASLIGNMSFTFISLTAGFLVNFDTIPVYIGWVRYISFLSYAYRILMSNEFAGRTFSTCSDPSCDIQGDDILNSYGIFPHNSKGTWAPLIAIGLAYNLIALLALKYLLFPPNGAMAVEFLEIEDELLIQQNIVKDQSKHGNNQLHFPISETDPTPEQPNDAPSALSIQSDEGTSIQIKSVSLNVRQANFLNFPSENNRKHSSFKPILHNINAMIPSGKLCAIMGGSGSGNKF